MDTYYEWDLHQQFQKHWKQANEWGMMKWQTWSQTLRSSEKWMGRMEWRTACKSAGGTGRLTSSWSCIRSWCWRPEACRCKMNLHPRVWWHSHQGEFVWKHQRNIFRCHINGPHKIPTRHVLCLSGDFLVVQHIELNKLIPEIWKLSETQFQFMQSFWFCYRKYAFCQLN